MQSPTVSATPPTAPIPDLPGYLASAPLRDEHIQPVEKIGLALNCVARSDVPIGLLLTSRLRVIPTLKVRRIAMAGELLAYNPLFVERVSLTGCKVLLLQFPVTRVLKQRREQLDIHPRFATLAS